MKKILLLTTLILSSFVYINAQDQGQFWIGGSFGLQTSKNGEYDRVNNYNISPEIGYGLGENLALGMRIGYKHTEQAYRTAISSPNLPDGYYNYGKNKYDGFTINPFVRYVFLKGDIGGLFADGNVGYTYLKDKANDTTSNQFEVGIRPGVAIILSDQISLTGRFGFLGYTHDEIESSKSNKFDFNLDMDNILLGLNIAF